MLKKLMTHLPLLAMIFLSACATPTAISTAVPAETKAATVASAPTATSGAAEATPVGAPTLPVSTAPATCEVVDSLLPQIAPENSPEIPAVDEKNDWIMGSADAPITLIEYSDYECPYCQQFSGQLKTYLTNKTDDIRFVYRHFPLTYHEKTPVGVRASEAAGLQGKFWEMHDFLFATENWKVWMELENAEAFKKYIIEKAAPSITGLDVAKFTADLDSPAMEAKLKAARESSSAVAAVEKNGMGGTPTFYLLTQGKIYNVPASFAVFDNIINLVKLDKVRFKECPPVTISKDKQYTATLKTDKGDIVIKLFPDKAPTTVNSFIFLAKQGFYDGISFHRVITDFVAQTGDPSNSGMGGSGYQFGTEIAEGLLFDREGLVGMARAQEPNTNASQFFITMAPLPNLNQRYTIFGEVISGMDVVRKLTVRDVSSQQNPPAGDNLISVTIEEK